MEDDLEKERGTYAEGKRRGAVPAGLARSGGRQTQLRRHLNPDNGKIPLARIIRRFGDG